MIKIIETHVLEQAKTIITYRTLETMVRLGSKYPEYLHTELNALDRLTGYARREDEYTIPHFIAAFKQQYLTN